MPDVIKAALSTALSLSTPHSALIEAPKELQYMPPGTHRINASRNGKPVTLDITVDASTADRLNQFLQAQLSKATEGSEDRPFFDFNHEDREAAAWPTEFYWAGDDPKSGLLDKMQLQQKKLAEVQAGSPGADFQTIFAKAQAEAPDLFR